MDVTPQLLTEIEFRQSLRGYDPDEVDRFLEQAAAAVAKLQGRLREALDRADAAERGGGARSAAVGTSEVSTETITRTLMLAQRTADDTVAAAQVEAEQIRTTARAEVEGLDAEVATRRLAMNEAMEAEAQEMASATTERINAEITQLELRRDALRATIVGMQPQLDMHRNRLAATTAALQELVDDGESFTLDVDLVSSVTGDATDIDGEGEVSRDETADDLDDGEMGEQDAVADIAQSEVPEDDNAVADTPDGDADDGGEATMAHEVFDYDADDEVIDLSGDHADPAPGASVFGDGDTEAMTDFFADDGDGTVRRFGRGR